MKLDGVDAAAVNAAFREEVARWEFRFRCEDCVHYAPVADRCSLEFLSAWLTGDEQRMVTDEGHITFCKYFELL